VLFFGFCISTVTVGFPVQPAVNVNAAANNATECRMLVFMVFALIYKLPPLFHKVVMSLYFPFDSPLQFAMYELALPPRQIATFVHCHNVGIEPHIAES